MKSLFTKTINSKRMINEIVEDIENINEGEVVRLKKINESQKTILENMLGNNYLGFALHGILNPFRGENNKKYTVYLIKLSGAYQNA